MLQRDETTQHMFDLLSEGIIDEHNVRMSYIASIIQKYKYLGTPITVELTDNLADKIVKELAELDVILHGLCNTYAQFQYQNRNLGEGNE